MSDGRVAALGQQVEACAFGQASAALMGATRSGTSAAELAAALAGARRLARRRRDDPGRLAGPRRASPGARAHTARHGAILLPFRALLAAIEAAR